MGPLEKVALPHKSTLWFIFWIYLFSILISTLVFGVISNESAGQFYSVVISILSTIVSGWWAIYFISKRSQILVTDVRKVPFWLFVINAIVLLLSSLIILRAPTFNYRPEIEVLYKFNTILATLLAIALLFIKPAVIWYFLKQAVTK